jgi:hypothetical protein
MVDPDDPAYRHILIAAMHLSRFGFDPSDPDIAARAIEAGRRDYEKDPRTIAQRYAREVAETRFSAPPDVLDGGEVVYYMRIGNRVKIGWSTSLAARLAAINPEELMATEPGGRKLERLRHNEFREFRTHGEWFRLEGLLASHIEALQEVAS